MADTTTADAMLEPPKGRSLWDDAKRRLFANPLAVASLWVLGALVLLAVLGPLLWIHPIEEIYRDRVALPPTLEHGHILGTDTEGRDLFARLVFGLSVSLMVGAVATLVALLIGVLWGAIAGYFGGPIDAVMMRIVDVLYAVPLIFFVILLTVVFGNNIVLIFLAIGAVEWLTTARIVRGQTITLKNKEFIEAARAAGAGWGRIVLRHLVPNLLGPVIVFATINVARVILLEAFLSFLGLGVQEPLTSLGVLISVGAREMDESWWLLVFPGAMMFLTLICFNFLGDGLRDALDPKER